MFVTHSFLGDFISVVVTLLIILFLCCKWNSQYWFRRGVPYLEPHLLYGNFSKVLRRKESIAVTIKKIYDVMKQKGWKYGGVYILTRPKLFLRDLDLIKTILTKDFQYFADRDLYYNKKDPGKAHLVHVKGTEWKNLRAKLTPTFTSGKIKMMFNVMSECRNGLLQRMEKECQKNGPIHIREILACFATNVIGSAAFGLEFISLEDDDSEFRKMEKKIFEGSHWHTFKRVFAETYPEVALFFDVSLAKKDLVDFFTKLVQETIEYREKNNVVRNDFMQMMINLKNNKQSGSDDDDDGKSLTLDQVTSQCMSFIGAGFETSSNLMTFALYELSKNQQIQERLRNEIDTVLEKHKDEISYDAIQAMPYLNQVINESLRKHPPAVFIDRKCVKDYQIPNEDVIIEKGTGVMIPIFGIHHDEEIYPNPTKFDPERFNEENRSSRHNYAYIPFGEGPRNCIGMKFGLLQAKIGLVSLIKHYRFTVDKKTQEPLVYNLTKLTVALSADGEIWLRAQKL